MPIYKYLCECGLRFEAFNSASKHSDPRKCPDCEEMAPRLMPEGVTGMFKKEVTGPVPQNTGISGLDAHIDRTIGASAEQGWDEHGKRVADKKKVLEDNPGASGHDLSRTPDGDWRVMKPEERASAETARRIDSLAMGAHKERRQQRPGRADETTGSGS